ncbi:MAG: flagellar assembly protein FliW [Oscillospiraceae bacterium]|jgi:flagellar assembly factor FliW|nr:flagellar assembly protein FliW [Oscillospiraceae bacterium]
MLLETARFGQIEIDGDKLLRFRSGVPGLEEYRVFAVLRFEESHPIMWLQSAEEPRVSLPVIDPFIIKPDYVFDISDEDAAELGLLGADEVQALSVLVIPEKMEDMTVNFAAPVVINTRTGDSKQLILGGDAHAARVPVFLDIARYLREESAERGGADADPVEKDK